MQGELLNIAKVGRGQMGAYLCIARLVNIRCGSRWLLMLKQNCKTENCIARLANMKLLMSENQMSMTIQIKFEGVGIMMMNEWCL